MSLIPAHFLKGSVVSAAAAIAVGVFGYLTRRLLANTLAENDYAFFYSTFALFNLMTLFVQCGTADVVLYELPGLLETKHKRSGAAIYRFILKFQSFNALICTAGILLLFPLWEKYYFNYPVTFFNFLIFVLILWGMTLESTTLFALNSLKKFSAMSVLRVVKSGLFFFGCWLFAAMNMFAGIITSCVIVTVACSLYGVGLVNKMMPDNRNLLPQKMKCKAVNSGIIFMILASGNIVIQDLGTCTLSLFSSSREVVLYNIALPLSMIVQAMLVVLNVFAPMIAECCIKNNKKALKKLFNTIFISTAAMLTLAVPVFYYGGELIIKIMFSEKFIAAKWCAFFLIEAALLTIPVRSLMILFNAAKQKRTSLKAIVPMALATIIVFPLLSHWYGATGAGIAALLATGFWLAAYLYHYRKFMELPEIC